MAFDAKVSIALITYNQEQFVGRTIESILNQSYQNFELIIGDDCSTDSTLEVISSYKDERIKLHKTDFNIGINGNLNPLVANAKGDYIVFLAGDDKLRQNYLATIVKYFKEMPDIDVLYQQLCPIDKNDNYIHTNDTYHAFTPKRSLEENLHLAFMQHNIFCSPAMALRKRVVDTIFPLPYSLVNFQDYAMHLDILINGFKVYVLDEILVDYRISGENISINNDKYLIREDLEINFLMDYFLKIKDVKLLKRIFAKELDLLQPYADTIPFFLGQMSFLSHQLKRREWGYRTIMEFLSKKKNFDIVHKRYNFTFKDYLNLVEKMRTPQNDKLLYFEAKCKKYKKRFNVLLSITLTTLLAVFIIVLIFVNLGNLQ